MCNFFLFSFLFTKKKRNFAEIFRVGWIASAALECKSELKN